MFDMKWIRENQDLFSSGLAKRGLDSITDRLVFLDEKYRETLSKVQKARAQRNSLSQEIGVAKARKDISQAQEMMDEVGKLKKLIDDEEKISAQVQDEMDSILSSIPNLPLSSVPEGHDETCNVFIRDHGSKPALAESIRQHFEVGESLGLMDFESAAKLSGSRFVVLRGALARLERALANFMLDLHTSEFGYTEVSVPVLVEGHALFGTGQLPKFANDQFCTHDDLWLIPTAEVPLTNLVREKILNASDLPMRLVSWSLCFRSEAGSAGRDTRGMIRQHQFSKVELVSITEPDQSDDELERLCACAEEVLKRLGLHYRVVQLCAGDMGFSAAKTYDIEVWLPGQNKYREIASCSLCGDFQARRMQARYRPETGAAPVYVHTLNGSGLAVGRTLIAVLENYQQGNDIIVPDVLRSYMGGLDRISCKS